MKLNHRVVSPKSDFWIKGVDDDIRVPFPLMDCMRAMLSHKPVCLNAAPTLVVECNNNVASHGTPGVGFIGEPEFVTRQEPVRMMPEVEVFPAERRRATLHRPGHIFPNEPDP